MSERKPKERRPLVQPGSVLGGDTDILSSVLSSYAETTGQPAPVVRGAEPASEEAETGESKVSGDEAPPSAPQEDPVPEAPKPLSRPTESARQPADKPARQQKTAKPKRSASALEEAETRAQTPKRLCSYRIPEGLDDWIEEYAFQHRHAGLKKQDLVAEALQLLIVSKLSPDNEETTS